MSEIVWESDAQSSGFTIMSNGMVWPDDWPGTLVEAQFTSARGDGADLDRDPDMVPSGPGRVAFTPQVRTVGYDGEHGKRIVSLHPFEAVVGDDGFLYTPGEYGGPGIRGIVLPSNNSDVVDEHDWTWRVTFDIPDTTIRPTHIPTPHDHSVDIKDYLDSDANHGVRVVVDRVAARETLTARDETIAARDLVLPARDQTLTARDETLQHGITVDTSVGTRVYVGDTMIFYDSGWRTLISWNEHGEVTSGTPIPAGLQPAYDDGRANGHGGLFMRRVNYEVYCSIVAGTMTADTFEFTMPLGFRGSASGMPYPLVSMPAEDMDTREYTTALVDVGAIVFRVRGKPNLRLGRSVTLYGAEFSWSTDAPAPTSLPGLPK